MHGISYEKVSKLFCKTFNHLTTFELESFKCILKPTRTVSEIRNMLWYLRLRDVYRNLCDRTVNEYYSKHERAVFFWKKKRLSFISEWFEVFKIKSILGHQHFIGCTYFGGKEAYTIFGDWLFLGCIRYTIEIKPDTYSHFDGTRILWFF